MRPDKHNSRTAFTIVEMTVAMAVSAIVLAAAYELFRNLTAAAKRQDKVLAQSWEVTNALEQIREDLMHAVPKADDREAAFIGGETKLMQFYSLCPSEHVTGLSGIRQLCRIDYELAGQQGDGKLYRQATPVIACDQGQADHHRQSLCVNIKQALVLFQDGDRVRPTFRSKQHLPAYVEIRLKAYDRTWPLTVRLPCGSAEPEKNL
jgi:prepilin-type N-terminal cleavage/methylation domain-containing protein